MSERAIINEKTNFVAKQNKNHFSPTYSSDQRAYPRFGRCLNKYSSDQRAYPRFGKFKFSRFEKLENSFSQSVGELFPYLFCFICPYFFGLFSDIYFHSIFHLIFSWTVHHDFARVHHRCPCGRWQFRRRAKDRALGGFEPELASPFSVCVGGSTRAIACTHSFSGCTNH